MEPVVIESDVKTVLQDLQLGIANDGRTTVTRLGDDTLEVRRSRIAKWVVLCCIFLFPVGLFALLAPKRLHQAVLVASDNGDRSTTVRVAGTLSQKSRSAIEEVASFHRR